MKKIKYLLHFAAELLVCVILLAGNPVSGIIEPGNAGSVPGMEIQEEPEGGTDSDKEPGIMPQDDSFPANDFLD